MSVHDAVLFANEAFYVAFANADLDAMDDVWSQAAPVACIHPGWQALTTRNEVLESWARIFSNDQQPAIACRGAQAFLQGDVSFVICYEVVGSDVLVATNIFRREGSRWRMVHHQSGPAAGPAPAADEPEASLRPN